MNLLSVLSVIKKKKLFLGTDWIYKVGESHPDNTAKQNTHTKKAKFLNGPLTLSLQNQHNNSSPLYLEKSTSS